MKNSEKMIRTTLDSLPHAFDYLYWNLADTTYKEEVFLALLKANGIVKQDALKMQSKIFPKNRLLRKIIKGEITESMGCYGDFGGEPFYIE